MPKETHRTNVQKHSVKNIKRNVLKKTAKLRSTLKAAKINRQTSDLFVGSVAKKHQQQQQQQQQQPTPDQSQIIDDKSKVNDVYSVPITNELLIAQEQQQQQQQHAPKKSAPKRPRKRKERSRKKFNNTSFRTSRRKKKKMDINNSMRDSNSSLTQDDVQTIRAKNNDIDWMRDLISLNRTLCKRKKLYTLCSTICELRQEEKALERIDKIDYTQIKRDYSVLMKELHVHIKDMKKLRKQFVKTQTDSKLVNKVVKAIESSEKIVGKAKSLQETDQRLFLRCSMLSNKAKLQASLAANLERHALDLDCRVAEEMKIFLKQVPSHQFTTENHQNMVLATSMYQLSAWEASKFSRHGVSITAKRKSHVTKFNMSLNKDVPDAHIPRYPGK